MCVFAVDTCSSCMHRPSCDFLFIRNTPLGYDFESTSSCNSPISKIDPHPFYYSHSMASLTNDNYDGILLGMGNPLMDISANVGQDMFDKYDLKPGNAILHEEKQNGIYEDLMQNFSPDLIPGGSTLNAIRVCNWMLGVDNATAFTGCVGSDAYAKTMEEVAMGEGVNVQFMKDANTPTGTCATFIMDAERSLCTNLAAANLFKNEHLNTPEMLATIEKAKFFYNAGFFLTVDCASIQQIAKHAAENDKTYMMNLSAPFLVDFFSEQMNAAMPYVDVLFGNEIEAASFAKKQGWGEISTGECALRAARLPKASGARPRMVVFTQGKDATCVALNGVLTTYDVEVLPKEKLVDTNGAGDAFVGGFLSQFIQGKDIRTCVLSGHYSAREIIQRSGCALPSGRPVLKL